MSHKTKRFRCTRVTQYRSFPERRGREQRCTHDHCRRKAIEPTVNGRPIDDDRIYSIATIDYVANGGDHMTPFLNAIERKNSNTFMRDAVINFIERENREGHTIAPPKGGRIISSNNK